VLPSLPWRTPSIAAVHGCPRRHCSRLCCCAGEAGAGLGCDAHVCEAADCLRHLARWAECRQLRSIHRHLLCALAEQYSSSRSSWRCRPSADVASEVWSFAQSSGGSESLPGGQACRVPPQTLPGTSAHAPGRCRLPCRCSLPQARPLQLPGAGAAPLCNPQGAATPHRQRRRHQCRLPAGRHAPTSMPWAEGWLPSPSQRAAVSFLPPTALLAAAAQAAGTRWCMAAACGQRLPAAASLEAQLLPSCAAHSLVPASLAL
jgi:hypothetical protein